MSYRGQGWDTGSGTTGPVSPPIGLWGPPVKKKPKEGRGQNWGQVNWTADPDS